MSKFKSRIIINNDEIKFCYKCGKELEKRQDEGGFDLFYCSGCEITILTRNEVLCENHDGYIDHKGFFSNIYDTILKCPRCNANMIACGYTCSCGNVHEINELKCPKCAEGELDKEMVSFIENLDDFDLIEDLELFHKDEEKNQKRLEGKYAYNKKRAIKEVL